MSIPLFKVFMAPEVGDAVRDVLYSGYITEGPKVKEFEQALRNWTGSRYVTTTNSGTSALIIALKLAGVVFNSKVLTTPMTCSATPLAAKALGAQILWADVDPQTGNMSLEDVEKMLKTNENIRAIMCVDWAGYPCDLDGLNYLGEKYNVKIVEDAAHAFGSKYYGSHVGRQVDYTCFSFQAIKPLTTIDGGLVVCREKADDETAKLLRWFGIDRNAKRSDLRCEDDIAVAGNKWHMNDVNATVGLHNIGYIHKNIDIAKSNAAYYDSVLPSIKGLSILRREAGKDSAFWTYTFKVANGHRDYLMNKLSEAGITASKVHARNDSHSVFQKSQRHLPGLDEFYSEELNIPVGWWVTKEDRKYITDTIRTVMGDIVK